MRGPKAKGEMMPHKKTRPGRRRRQTAKVIPLHRIHEVEAGELLTESQVSTILGRAPSTLQKDRCYGRGLPYIKTGQQVRYRVGDIVEYIDAHRIGGRP